MAKNPDRLRQAEHNESVCNYLELGDKFYDWMITTAFYSALHYVSYKIFPFTYSGGGGRNVEISSIDQYHNLLGRNISKHQLLADLVSTHCPKISADYDWLLDMSMNARYDSYQQDQLIAQRAKALLVKVKADCK